MMVAEGSVDIAAEPKLALWDVAALIPIVEGAGGMITGINGESPLESLSAFTSNAALHPQLLEVFQTP
jgi:histidinol-phosphatase